MIKNSEINSLGQIEKLIDYKFDNQDLLLRAVTHKSYAKENPEFGRNNHNETLEFLGDAVLSVVSAEGLFLENTGANEGKLSHLRSAYVCQENLANAAKRLDLGRYLRAGASMRKSGSIELPSLLSDMVEAILGAVFLDSKSDISVARKLVGNLVGPLPKKAKEILKDSKTIFQEKIQSKLFVTPTYKVIGSKGPDHEPEFEVEIYVQDKLVATGKGSSKKKAEQEAAQNALDLVGSAGLDIGN